MLAPAKNIDAYLSLQPEPVRAALEKLRQTIKALVPGAEEVISYRMPTIRYCGRALVGFAGFKNHCSLFPYNSKLVKQFEEELKGFSTAKGTIRFTPEHPLPDELVKKIVETRMEENRNKMKMKI